MKKAQTQPPKILDTITDMVLAYRPEPKSSGSKRRKERAAIKTLDILEATSPLMGEPGFKTLSEAVDFSKAVDAGRRNDGVTSCIEQIIESVDCDDEALCLHLKNQQFLQFRCEQNIVDVTIENGAPTRDKTREAVLIRLGGREFVWKRDELMQALKGNAVRRIQMGQCGAFLYVANVGILWINVLINSLSGRPFLFWELTD